MTAAGHVTGTGPWLKRFHAAPKAGARLVCFPHAGAAASACHGFSASLTPRVEVLSVQYPGREDRYAEPMVDDVGLLADAVAAVLPPWCDRPLALFGHSMGAIVAFEVARRLGPRVDALFVSGRRAPSTYRAEDLHRRDDSGLVEAICALGGTDLRLLDAETVRMLLPLVRNDLRAAETYSHGAGPDLSCSVFASVGDHDPLTMVDEARGWAHHTASAFELAVYPGGHFYLREHHSSLIRTITDHLVSTSQVSS